MTTYTINYTIKAENGTIENITIENVTNIFFGFGEIEKKAKAVNGTIYRTYTKTQIFEEEIYTKGAFSKNKKD